MDIDDVKKQFPWLEKFPDFEEFFQETCHDCGAALGEVHDLNCDVPDCTCCGIQRIQCNCGGCETEPERWYGIMFFKGTSGLSGTQLVLSLSSRRWQIHFF
jgi:hypothetical protein